MKYYTGAYLGHIATNADIAIMQAHRIEQVGNVINFATARKSSPRRPVQPRPPIQPVTQVLVEAA